MALLLGFAFILSLLLPRSHAFAQSLELPATGFWSGLRDQTNILECINPGGEQGTLTVTLLDSNGLRIGKKSYSLQGNGALHIILNEFPIASRFGHFILEAKPDEDDNDPNFQLSCVNMLYRFLPPGSEKEVEYIMSLPVREALTGASLGFFNRLNPEDGSPNVSNTLSIVNLAEENFNAVVKLFDQTGTFLRAYTVRDLESQHAKEIKFSSGQTGLYQILPYDSDLAYDAVLRRIGKSDSYTFAMSTQSSPGSCDLSPLPLSTVGGATNWVIIGNPTLGSVRTRIRFLNANGVVKYDQTRVIGPYVQYPILANQYLSDNSSGSLLVSCKDVETQGNDDDLLLVESVVYGHPSSSPGKVSWAYTTQPLPLQAEKGMALAFPGNTFHQAANWISLLNGNKKEVKATSVEKTVFSDFGLLMTAIPEGKRFPDFSLASQSTISTPLHDFTGYNYSGITTLYSNHKDALLTGHLLRVYPTTTGEVGYIVSVPGTVLDRPLTSNAQYVQVGKDTPTKIKLTASHIEGKNTYYWIDSWPSNGDISGSPPDLTYTPHRQFLGEDSFSFRLWDETESSVAGTVYLNVGQWEPPVGVPHPGFGFEEQPAKRPKKWDRQRAGFYYVDRQHNKATDKNNEFGWPGKPRRSIPSSLAPGAVVELHGEYNPGVFQPITLSGTKEQPIFIRGRNQEEKPKIVQPLHISGSYLIFENIEFGDRDGDRADGPSSELLIFGPAHHVVVRYSDIHGNVDAGGVHIFGWLGAAVHHVVIYENDIHENGDRYPYVDRRDIHGVSIGAGAHDIWVAGNDIWRSGGHGVFVDATAKDGLPATHHVYVGNNEISDNRYSGVWVKDGEDVIVSQNLIRYHYPTELTPGAGAGFEGASKRIWFLLNEIANSEVGIASLPASDEASVGLSDSIYVLGNLLHDFFDTGDTGAGALKDGVAIRFAESGSGKLVLHNTIHDANIGLAYSSTQGAISLANNIFSEMSGSDIYLESPTVAAGSSLNTAIFSDRAKIKWGSASAFNVKMFREAFPGQCQDCMQRDIEFVREEWGDFRLKEQSPARNHGSLSSLSPVLATFLQWYGINIAVDLDKTARVKGSAPDLGAYESKRPVN